MKGKGEGCASISQAPRGDRIPRLPSQCSHWHSATGQASKHLWHLGRAVPWCLSPTLAPRSDASLLPSSTCALLMAQGSGETCLDEVDRAPPQRLLPVARIIVKLKAWKADSGARQNSLSTSVLGVSRRNRQPAAHHEGGAGSVYRAPEVTMVSTTVGVSDGPSDKQSAARRQRSRRFRASWSSSGRDGNKTRLFPVRPRSGRSSTNKCEDPEHEAMPQGHDKRCEASRRVWAIKAATMGPTMERSSTTNAPQCAEHQPWQGRRQKQPMFAKCGTRNFDKPSPRTTRPPSTSADLIRANRLSSTTVFLSRRL